MKKAILFLFIFSIALISCGDFDDYEDEPYDDELTDAQSYMEDDPADKFIDSDVDQAGEGNTAVSPQFQTADCPFDAGDADVECGYLTVPENRQKANSPAIQLAVAILRAPNGDQNSPIVFLEGGPGGSPLATFSPEEWDFPFTQNRDLILVDQRGTGYSIPTLDCPEMSEEYDYENGDPEADCHDRLAAEGIDFTAYNTTENAADIADLKAALDIDEWNLFGVSYGTRLAFDIMRDHPEGIRSVLLDSPFPPNAQTPVDEIVITYDLMQSLFEACADDAYCSEEYPDLEEVFLETVAALNDSPDGDIIGDDLFAAVNAAMQDVYQIPYIPYLIYEVADGNYDAMEEVREGYARAAQNDDVDRSDSEGMYNSVICHDEYVFETYDEVETAVSNRIPAEVEPGLLQSAYQMYQMCGYWGAGAAGALEDQAVSSAIPTLILVGQYDTATPSAWARLAAQTLDNAYLYEFPGAGHSLITTVECSVEIADQFLDDPDTKPSADCINQIEWPYFE